MFGTILRRLFRTISAGARRLVQRADGYDFGVVGTDRWATWLLRLFYGMEWLALPVLLIGLGRHGCPYWPEALVFLLPVGVVFMVHGVLIAERIDARFDSLSPKNRLASIAAYTLGGLAAAGMGANRIHSAAGFRALAVPVCLAFAGYGLVLVVRGPRVVPERVREKWQWRFPRVVGMGVFALGAFGAALALGLTHARDRCG